MPAAKTPITGPSIHDGVVSGLGSPFPFQNLSSPQTGSGSPNNVVTPRSVPDFYIDTTNEGLYMALGPTNTSWVGFAGNIVDTVNPHTEQTTTFTALNSGATLGCSISLGSTIQMGTGGSGSGSSLSMDTTQVFFIDGAGDFFRVTAGGVVFQLSTLEAFQLTPGLFQFTGNTQVELDSPGMNSGAAWSHGTQTFVSGTGKQVTTVSDSMLYVPVTGSGTLTLTMGPTSNPTTAVCSALAVTTGQLLSVFVPKSYFCKFTLTTATIGTCNYFTM